MQISFEALDQIGFTKSSVTIRRFPPPLNTYYRIDFVETVPNMWEWEIYFDSGYATVALKFPQTMEQVANFYFGICDKPLNL